MTFNLQAQYWFNNFDTLKNNAYDCTIRHLLIQDSVIYTNGTFNINNNYHTIPYKFLNKYDLYGNLLLKKIVLDNNSSNIYNDFIDKIILANNSIINVGIQKDTVDYIQITSYTNNFDTNWSVQYPSTLIRPDTIYLNNIFDVVQTPDGGFLIGGDVGLTPFLLKISSNGSFQWKKIFPFGSMIYKVVTTPDLGFILVTSKNSGTIIKTSALGNIIWEKQLNDYSIRMSSCDFKKLDSNQFLFCTTYLRYYNDFSYYGLFIMKINNSDGTIVWQKKHNPFSQVFRNNINLHIVDNGKFYISYMGGTFHNSIYNFDIFGGLQFFNSFGDSLDINKFKIANPQTNECQSYLTDGKFYSDGSFIGGGKASGCYQTLTNHLWLFRTLPITHEYKTEEHTNEIKIFPNPSMGVFMIQNINSFNEPKISIYNVEGQLIKQIDNISKNNLQINMNNFPAGLYLLILNGRNGAPTYRKIIIENK